MVITIIGYYHLLTGDARKGSFLFQRISIAIQRCNAISFTGSFIQPFLSSGDTWSVPFFYLFLSTSSSTWEWGTR